MVGPEWGLKMCISDMFPGDAESAGLGTTLKRTTQVKDDVDSEGLLVISGDDSHILCLVASGHSCKGSTKW